MESKISEIITLMSLINNGASINEDIYENIARQCLTFSFEIFRRPPPSRPREARPLFPEIRPFYWPFSVISVI